MKEIIVKKKHPNFKRILCNICNNFISNNRFKEHHEKCKEKIYKKCDRPYCNIITSNKFYCSDLCQRKDSSRIYWSKNKNKIFDKRVCKLCNRKISITQFNKHYKKCKKYYDLPFKKCKRDDCETLTREKFCSSKCRYIYSGIKKRGFHHTSVVKLQISNTLKNSTKSRKGKKHTEESRKKLSESHKNKYPTDETRKKMSDAHSGKNNAFYGKHHSEEMKKRFREKRIREIKEIGQWAKPGNNEKKLLDQQEKIDNCIIDRNYDHPRYFPDGYCYKTNTLYEVYEVWHKKTFEKDNIRRLKLQDELKCHFVIIYDGWNDNKIERFIF